MAGRAQKVNSLEKRYVVAGDASREAVFPFGNGLNDGIADSELYLRQLLKAMGGCKAEQIKCSPAMLDCQQVHDKCMATAFRRHRIEFGAAVREYANMASWFVQARKRGGQFTFTMATRDPAAYEHLDLNPPLETGTAGFTGNKNPGNQFFPQHRGEVQHPEFRFKAIFKDTKTYNRAIASMYAPSIEQLTSTRYGFVRAPLHKCDGQGQLPKVLIDAQEALASL